MNSIIFLITLLAIYYYIYQNYYDRFEEKYHYYFYTFIGVYIVILYIYHFEYEFFYRLLKNIYDTNKQPLYEFNTMNSNAELFTSQYPSETGNPLVGFNIKETLLNKQSGRCYACSNFIMNSDLQHSKLKYKNPLQNGGQNNIENIGLLCSQCYEFQ
tara:strand:+ start:1422 stop:1892 length:471 start_codon:yes stop_codon:yes gene_type:complete